MSDGKIAPKSKKVFAKCSPGLHLKALVAAKMAGINLEDWAAQAMAEKIERDGNDPWSRAAKIARGEGNGGAS